MKRTHLFQRAAAGIAGLGMLLPQAAFSAQPVVQPAIETSSELPAVADVALLEGGTLQGQVLDAQGTPIDDSLVTVGFAGGEVASARTDRQGLFAVRGLRGGTYQVSAAGGSGVFRLWAPNSAPPAAIPGVLIVAGQPVTRGQYFRGNTGGALIMLGVLGGIVTAGVISASTHESGS